MRRWHKYIILISFITLLIGSCTVLKPYERVYVNEPEMKTGATSDKNFENYFESIREGSVAATGKKGSGGCGCN